MKEYLFDVKLFAAIRVRADDEAAARAILSDTISGGICELDGLPFEASMDGEADLLEVDGVDV